jgi:hypothetical protein
VKYIVHIDDVRDDRPAGSVELAGQPTPVPFDGWVELLRVLEQSEAAAAATGTGRGAARP